MAYKSSGNIPSCSVPKYGTHSGLDRYENRSLEKPIAFTLSCMSAGRMTKSTKPFVCTGIVNTKTGLEESEILSSKCIHVIGLRQRTYVLCTSSC